MTEAPPAEEVLQVIQDLINNGDPPRDTLDEITSLLRQVGFRLPKLPTKRAQYMISINFDDADEEADAYGDLVMAAHTISRNSRVTIDFAYDKTVEINEPRTPRPRCADD